MTIKRKLVLVEKRNNSQYVLIKIIPFQDKIVILKNRKLGYAIDLEKPIYQKGLIYYYASDYITGEQIFLSTAKEGLNSALMNPEAIYELFNGMIVEKVVRNADKSQKQSVITMIIVFALGCGMGALLTYSIMLQNQIDNNVVVMPI